MVMDSELKDMTYAANFHKDMDHNSKIIVNKYHPDKDFILMSQLQSTTELETCKFRITYLYRYYAFIFD